MLHPKNNSSDKLNSDKKSKIYWGTIFWKLGIILFFVLLNVIPYYKSDGYYTLIITGILTLVNIGYIKSILEMPNTNKNE